MLIFLIEIGLQESIQHRTIQNEINYEVLGDRIAGATLAPRRSRESHQVQRHNDNIESIKLKLLI